MKTIFILILAFTAIAAGLFFINKKSSKDNPAVAPFRNLDEAEKSSDGSGVSSEEMIKNDNLKNINMKLTSSAFENNQYIPAKYTCDGDNVNPPLSITGTPEEAKSLVLIVDDPDATNGDWTHWTVFNIAPDAKAIKENSVPAGSIEGKTNFRNPGYGGPCPPSGIHHYQFKLYALPAVLNLDATAGKKDIEKAMEDRILAQDLLVGLYKRK